MRVCIDSLKQAQRVITAMKVTQAANRLRPDHLSGRSMRLISLGDGAIGYVLVASIERSLTI